MHVALVVDGVLGELREVLGRQQHVQGRVLEVLSLFEGRSFPGRGEQVDHFGSSLVVDEDVGRLDISDFAAVLPHVDLGRHQREQQVPQLGLLEEGLLGLPPPDLLLEIDGKVGIVILDS